MKIVVVGLGYVGLSNAVLLAQHNEVIGADISQECVDSLNARKSQIIDVELSEYLAEKDLNLLGSMDLNISVRGSDYVIVSTPTNYDKKTNFFDTSSSETVIAEVIANEPNACIVVKSTIPFGFIDNVRSRLEADAVIFWSDFLREGKAAVFVGYSDVGKGSAASLRRAAPHGVGAFYRRDPTKVDRSATTAARYLAKNVVASGLADKCTIQLSFAIGAVCPLSTYANTFGTGQVSDQQTDKVVSDCSDLTPCGICKHLGLNKPIYQSTAAHGYFGRAPDVDGDYSSESDDLIVALKNAK